MAKKKSESPGTLGKNRKAYFNYTVEESMECGIELKGTEVKSLRSSHFNFVDSYCDIKDGQLWLHKLNINLYGFGNIHNHVTDRPRRLLVHKKEIVKLDKKIREKGYTLIPLKFYLKGSLVKIDVGLCKGKKLYDKRDTIKNRDMDRDQSRKSKFE